MRLGDQLDAFYREQAEKRAALHLDWKKDVKAVDGGHCFYRPHRNGALAPICEREARWEVDGITYCDRHLVLSER